MSLHAQSLQWYPTLCNPVDCSPPNSSDHGILQARILEWVAISFSRGSSQTRVEPWSATLQVDSLPAEPPGKLKNTGVCSLFLLQQIYPTQELNWGLLPCRWSLYQLSYQGSPFFIKFPMKQDSNSTIVACLFCIKHHAKCFQM